MSKENPAQERVITGWASAMEVAKKIAKAYRQNDPDKIVGIIKKAMDQVRQDERENIALWLKVMAEKTHKTGLLEKDVVFLKRLLHNIASAVEGKPNILMHPYDKWLKEVCKDELEE